MTTPYIISTPPPTVGFVAAFIGGGTTIEGENSGDPNGWVISDGITRKAPNNDGRYAALAPLLDTYLDVAANTNNPNQITPPDYRNRFLRGQTGSSNTISLSGTGSVKLIATQIPTLDTSRFVSNDPGHNHGANARADSAAFGNFTLAGEALINTGGTLTTSTVNNNSYMNAKYLNTSQSTINILPPYFSINYIIKY